MFSEAFVESAFSLTDVLFLTFSTFDHINKVFRVAGNVFLDMSFFRIFLISLTS